MGGDHCRQVWWCRLYPRFEHQNAQYQGNENADEQEKEDADFVHDLLQPSNVGIWRQSARALPGWAGLKNAESGLG